MSIYTVTVSLNQVLVQYVTKHAMLSNTHENNCNEQLAEYMHADQKYSNKTLKEL